jgi:hypothetical protein
VPTTDLGSHAPWLESQRRSRSRRFEAVRRLRRQRSRRSLVGAALVSLSLAAGGAVAHETGGRAADETAAAPAAVVSVVAIQQALGVAADGIVGPQTRRALRRFQRSQGLPVDGVAGPQTVAALGLLSGGGGTQPASTAATGVGTTLQRIAACESGGDPTAISRDGRYRGKYQFTRGTWRAMGGIGDPAQAPEAEQDQRAAALLASQGTAPWPVCSAA